MPENGLGSDFQINISLGASVGQATITANPGTPEQQQAVLTIESIDT